MLKEWIKAHLALRYVAQDGYELPAILRICERAHSGLIAAKADNLLWGDRQANNVVIPKDFWWAEGQEALEQDWRIGDFATWIDQKVEVKAHGVSFDFLAISDLVPAGEQGIAMRTISVVGDDDWLSAADVLSLMFSKTGSGDAERTILEACRTGQIAGRAMRASGEGASLPRGAKNAWARIEWDIPLWFWRGFTDPQKSSQNWQLGIARGRGQGPSGPDLIELQGIHFHRSGLANLGLDVVDTPTSPQTPRGRKPTYDWQEAQTAIWGQIYRGELIPENQAQIERAIIGYLTEGDREPGESSVRPYAKIIWEEFSKADN